jgi:hypothetical protein
VPEVTSLPHFGHLVPIEIFAPQLGQNLEPAATEALHFGQVLPPLSIFAPQLEQNLAFSSIKTPHFGHGFFAVPEPACG